ncbi:Alpha/Beta hydrolase protein [Coniella lustricola]|uniref:Alpha/Beta hydrolase protein n=1 Tax=Coniella lustricola TaxID=2025994 RepID=A0A2T3ADI9_9PEZI|nr:Alpha/Beta hydrolase protein [Coniella lustricola]
MAAMTSWDTVETPRDELVNGANGAHLFLRARGAPRQPGEPVVIFEAGLGVSSATWAAVQRLLDPRIRSIRYDRAGYGRSPPSKNERTASNIAAELLDVLRAAKVQPPYIIAASSFGGIIGREFLAAAGQEAMAGMVFVDTAHEKTAETLRFPHQAIAFLLNGRDYFEAIGFFDDCALTPEEIQQFKDDAKEPTAIPTADGEGINARESAATLGERKQFDAQILGMKPVIVIRGDSGQDFRRMLKTVAGDEQDADTIEYTNDVKEFISERLDKLDRACQMEQLKLSGNSRFLQAQKSTHAVITTEPELVAEAILDVWQRSISGKLF